jgi:hypothetical protein
LHPIDPTALQEERDFRIRQGGGLSVIILVYNSKGEGSDSGAAESKNRYQRSVATIDLIARNADLVASG